MVPDSWTQFLDHNGQDGGFFTSVSSNGNANGIIWAIGRPDGSNDDAVYLDAFDANTGNPLVTDLVAGYWPNAGQTNANVVPVVTNGKVYVASYAELAIFGLKPPKAHATIKPVAVPELELPAGLHRITGRVESASGHQIVLATRSGTPATVDIATAIRSGHAVVAGDTLTIVGQYHADGTLAAQSVSRAKSNPAQWLSDR